MSPHPEIGRELKPSELKPYTVVVTMKEGIPQAATMWVIEVAPTHVLFALNEARIILGAFRNGDVLTDDTGAVIKVYEYLGD
jgi:hypothetical protein